MFVSLIIIFILTVSGMTLTYVFKPKESLMWRLCVGNVAGQTTFGLVCFITACLVGFSTTSILIALLISALPLILFSRKDIKQNFSKDWMAAKRSLEDANFDKFLGLAYYAAFLILFYFFFDRVMFDKSGAIFTGASNNLGDLPFHLGTIFSFTDGNNFPPQNPSFATAKFTYPFIADLIAASFVKIGANVRDAMFVQNITLAFSLLVVLERFVFKLVNNRLAGKIAPVLLFFCGGLGFLWFFKDASANTKGFYDFFWNLPRDYTISNFFRFGNSLITLFATQRSLLLGMPLTIIVLGKIWSIFQTGRAVQSEKTEKEEGVKDTTEIELDPVKNNFSTFSLFHFRAFAVGLFTGTLPLIHAHSLFVLFIICAVLFFFSAENWREWIAFGIGTALVAVPELIWAFSGSATHTEQFIEWFFGWDKRELGFFWFWLKNTGIFIPVSLFGLFLIFFPQLLNDKEDIQNISDKQQKTKDKEQRTNLLIFYIPFVVLFVISNIAKLAPWEWDNIKVLIYWFIGSLPFAAYALARLWEKNRIYKLIAAGLLIALTSAGALDVWRQMSGAINYKIFDADAVKIAEQIKQKTPPDAIFLNAPTYNTAVVLSGRLSIMRYGGHLSSHGIDFKEREEDLQRIYMGDAAAEILLKKYGIDFILLSPEELSYFQTNNLSFDESILQKFPVVAEAGEYKVYKVQ